MTRREKNEEIYKPITSAYTPRLLLSKLILHFNMVQLKKLCVELHIDAEDLEGDTLYNKSRGLIEYLERQGRLNELVWLIRRDYSEINLSDILLITPLNYFQNEAIEVLAEAKLILVGDGNVGKTSLVNRLVYGAFNDSESTTRGIAITRWGINLPLTETPKAQLNIWDFGGQGSMHATHPYFFSRRAVYLVVLNVREDNRFNRAEYWLRLIHTYGADSPTIVVTNKIDQYPTLLDERTLRDKYPYILSFVRTSCETGEGIGTLVSAISRAVCTLEDIGVRTPQSLVSLKRTLEGLTDPKAKNTRDTLSLDEYDALCNDHGVDPALRAGYLGRLNDLGVMLYFGDDLRLSLNAVLNPFWVIEGIYRIINYEALTQAGGKLLIDQIREILPQVRYPADKALYILDMMRKFELCFPLDEQNTTFLLPDLLPPQQPELPAFERDTALKLQFEYPIWQGVTLTRLLVRLNHYLVEGMYWRNGALLQSTDRQNRALIMADELDRRLRLWVDGNLSSRRSFLNRIREELNVIHGRQRDFIVKEWVVTPEGGEVEYQLLAQLEANGQEIHHVMVGNTLMKLNIATLLNGVRADVIPDRQRLKELMLERFSLNELDDLCFRFNISLEDIEGPGNKDAKTRNLVRQFERTRRIPELMAALRELRKGMVWE